MTDEVLPESLPKGDPVHFHSEGELSGCVSILTVCFGLFGTVAWVLRLLRWQEDSLFDAVLVVLMPVLFSSIAALGFYSLIKGRRLEGLLVDEEGIVDRTKRFPAGRIYWHEIKSVYLFNLFLLPFPPFSRFIGVDVADSYVRNQSLFNRFNIWLNRHLSHAPDIPLVIKDLSSDRKTILSVLEERLRKFELRSISEAKELESGS